MNAAGSTARPRPLGRSIGLAALFIALGLAAAVVTVIACAAIGLAVLADVPGACWEWLE